MKRFKLFYSEEGEDDRHQYHTYMEYRLRQLSSSLNIYISNQRLASFFLIICALIALIMSSVPALSASYQKILSLSIGFHVADLYVTEPLSFWVNNFLLTLFFFIVGLEIKKEFLVGHLVNKKVFLFVLITAIGGMVTPAIIYLVFNSSTIGQSGWGIPMATDTAFALGLVYCFKKYLPAGIFTFISALAIIDDILSTIIVAAFYTAHLKINFLCLGFFFSGILIIFNLLGFRKPLPYLLFGCLIWLSFEHAGVHGSLAGIIIAFVVPARPGAGPVKSINKVRGLLNRFEQWKKKNPLILKDENQQAILEKVEASAKQASTPLQRWSNKLSSFVSLFVLPVFAFVNIGIPISTQLATDVFTHFVPLGIVLGLIVGKPLGVILFASIALWSECGALPGGTKFQHIVIVSVLTGIGFTMSLFIANNTGLNTQTLLMAKGAILFASVISALLGCILLYTYILTHHVR